MSTDEVKQTLHQLIDKIEDKELLTIYLQLLEREVERTSVDFFEGTDDEMKRRAEASLQAIAAGQTRDFEAFKKDVEQWKKHRPTQ